MIYALAVAENAFLIVLLPLLMAAGSARATRWLDTRMMFSIPVCHGLAIGSGGLLAIAALLAFNVRDNIGLGEVWSISGPWHDGRFANILAAHLNEFASASVPGATRVDRVQSSLSHLLVVAAGLLTLANALVALAGWRSPGALRGVLAHLLIAGSTGAIWTLRVLAAVWVVHWLNFWACLVILVVMEVRRRESAAIKLSF